MEREDILELKRRVYSQKKYTVNEVKEYLKQIVDGTTLAAAFKTGRMSGWRIKNSITPEDVFKLVYICLEMTHDPKLQTDSERTAWMITQLEKEYL